jgi:hypothetical protein
MAPKKNCFVVGNGNGISHRLKLDWFLIIYENDWNQKFWKSK